MIPQMKLKTTPTLPLFPHKLRHPIRLRPLFVFGLNSTAGPRRLREVLNSSQIVPRFLLPSCFQYPVLIVLSFSVRTVRPRNGTAFAAPIRPCSHAASPASLERWGARSLNKLLAAKLLASKVPRRLARKSPCRPLTDPSPQSCWNP